MKLRNLFLGIDVLLLCILAGKVAEDNAKVILEQSVMKINQSAEETVDKSMKDLTKKKVALTFDDGPNADYTEMLLTGLRERGVHATFFLLGKEVKKSPQIVEKMHKEGHLIGNHSYEHINLSSLSDEAAISQVDKTNEAIYEIIGEYPQYIRPPFGSWKSNLDYETTMIEVMWNIDPLDWQTDNTNAVVEKVVKEIEENDIILMHDASKSSVDAALQIIDRLQREGFVFVTVDEILFD